VIAPFNGPNINK